MDTLTKLISTIEIAIRYLLTGTVISAIAILSINEYQSLTDWAVKNELVAAAAITAVGFVSFTLYRLALWIVLDAIAWKLRWSVPSLLHTNGMTYDEPYAFFLKWRYSGTINHELSGYLAFRWAAAHFVSVSGLALCFASLLNQEASLLSAHAILARALGLIFLILGLWQCAFLYRVERNLYRSLPQPQVQKQ
nr:hypothetical protein [Pseudomonas benzenivorans]